MNPREVRCITPGGPLWPSVLNQRLGAAAPETLWTMGSLELLALPKTALFCSTHCPGDAVLRAQEQAEQWAREERCVISGFHSPVEQECLRILLRGAAPVILCPARTIPRRLPAQQAIALAGGRLLVLSCFPPSVKRPTAATAARRNELVAALADERWFACVAPGGQLARLAQRENETPASRGGFPRNLDD